MADAGNVESYGVDDNMKRLFAPVVAAIRQHAARVAAVPGLVGVRPGFQSTAGEATPALILAVMPPATAATARDAADLSRAVGVPVTFEEASPQDQVAYFARGAVPSMRSDFLDLVEPPLEILEFRPPITGKYKPPADAPKLDPVEEQMVLTIATSPDAGWPTFREFLAQPVRRTMHVGIYQFTAPHVYKALRQTMLDDDDATLTMTLHPEAEKIPESGTKADDIAGPEVLDRLSRALGERFRYAHTTTGASGEFASAYHIKVAVADRARLFLSSGNWQSSNQPPFDPLNEPEDLPPSFHRKYNREHHVVIENPSLARTFAAYLEHDFERASRAAPEFAAPAAGVAALPDLLVPLEEDFLEFAPPTYFEPLTIRDKVKVRPVLTPDNYPDVAYDLVKGAKRRLWIQNQYINLNPSGDFDEFKRLVNLLRDKAKKIDVRIICRDLMKAEKLDMLLALGFPREVFKFMSATHTKVIIADDDKVMIGSHNLSNEGVVSNRDASVVISDRRAVEFCAEVFDHDWTRRATAKPRRSQPRLARPGERAPAGTSRVHWSALFDEPPQARATSPEPRPP
ncbi:MAG TPA: phospholipase D-like domain-containing protein, partial [Tepidisphaeraceae bacterium]|nr:phospholipase D-like domain-containing protein [Tepidisphaeraceae bacterium]